jgi:hypothetical protein
MEKNKLFLTLGSDPEFFVRDPAGDPFPATPFAIGTKDEPVPIVSLGEGFFEQRDNLSFEGNIPTCKNIVEFITNLTKLRNYFLEKVKKFDYSLSPNGVDYFADRYLESPEGLEFGCSSVISSWDSNISSIVERPTPKLDKVNFRVAGFHIHIGYDFPIGSLSKEASDILIGRLFDIFVTKPSHEIKDEPERLTTYGKYGIIRIKEYGVECRTLSSYFTQPEFLPWVYNQILKIEEFIVEADPDDLTKIVKNSFFISDMKTLTRVFGGIFDTFDYKDVVYKFNETRTAYEEYKKCFD